MEPSNPAMMPPPMPAFLNAEEYGGPYQPDDQVNQISDIDVAQNLLEEVILKEDVQDDGNIINVCQEKDNQDGNIAQAMEPNNDYQNHEPAPMDQQEASHGDEDVNANQENADHSDPETIEKDLIFYRRVMRRRQAEKEASGWKRHLHASDSEYDSDQGPSRSKRCGGPVGYIDLNILRQANNGSENNEGQRANRPRLSFTTNMLPEFDPLTYQQSVFVWLDKVEECAAIYDWTETEILHYALPKLSGVAKSWYESQITLICPWSEWRRKLVLAFPARQNFADLLREMLNRRVDFGDSLIHYYFEKTSLLNRCHISGTEAVDCLIDGIDDTPCKMRARSAKCKTVEDVLKFFHAINDSFEHPT